MPDTFSWSTVFVLKVHGTKDTFSDRSTITAAGKAYMKKYTVPKERCFTNDPLDAGAKFSYLPFGKPSTKLDKVATKDKLMVCAHGSTTTLAGHSPVGLADALYQIGLRAAGLITFKACDIGKGTFLEDFVTACNRPEKAIKVGWLKGYKGEACTLNGAHEEIINPEYDDDLSEFANQLKGHAPFLAGAARYKVVQGNNHTALSKELGTSTRYHA